MRANEAFQGGLYRAVRAMYARQSGRQQPAKGLRIPRPGVGTPGVKREPSHSSAGDLQRCQRNKGLAGAHRRRGLRDEGAQWPHVHTNKIAPTINLGNRPCSGLAAGFGAYGSPIGGATIWSIDPAQL
jgi:hypothetical protein